MYMGRMRANVSIAMALISGSTSGRVAFPENYVASNRCELPGIAHKTQNPSASWTKWIFPSKFIAISENGHRGFYTRNSTAPQCVLPRKGRHRPMQQVRFTLGNRHCGAFYLGKTVFSMAEAGQCVYPDNGPPSLRFTAPPVVAPEFSALPRRRRGRLLVNRSVVHTVLVVELPL